MESLCPVCHKGILTPITLPQQAAHGNRHFTVMLEYSCCAYCGFETTTAEQDRNNAALLEASLNNLDRAAA